MRDQQSSDTSIALDANTDVQQEADKPAVKWRYLFGFLAWTVPSHMMARSQSSYPDFFHTQRSPTW